MNSSIAIFCTFILVLASLPLSGAVDAASVTTIDKDHALWTTEKKEQYRDTGLATSVLVAPELTITASEDKDKCNARSATHPDIAYDFLCINYDEDIDRTIRLHVPSGYFGLHNGVVQSLEDNGEARVSVSPDDDYLIIHVDVDGPTKMTIPLSETGAVITISKETTRDAVSEFTGFGTAGDEWQYVPAGELSPESGAYVIQAPEGETAKQVLVEYQDEDSWSKPGRSSDTFRPIYTVERDGVEDKIYVHSTVADAPQVRYKLQPGPVDSIASIFNELVQGPERIFDWFDNLF